ncbi:hypothetical protein OPT61_g2417 [Boeremia exigua]|uniref:Uncharacterized protein n=1 Tax=Boeremia exigua TaxID=749465 RepID=A0ACC2ILT5_9PLEO|nr:hypothetical protein OPT61_g2417 [Boeremia exigua]
MQATLQDNTLRVKDLSLSAATKKIAIDCEMMRSNIGSVLGRVSIVNYEGETVLDTFVCYPGPVIVTKTNKEHSRIRWEDIEPQNGARPFSEVQTTLIELLRDRILIGHDIQKDLKAIAMDLSAHVERLEGRGITRTIQPLRLDVSVRDTQKYSGYRQYAIRGAHQGPNLKNLALNVLRCRIKEGRISSLEDAVATMQIYRKAEADIDREQGH